MSRRLTQSAAAALSVLLIAGAVQAQPPAGDPVADLLRDRPASQPADTESDDWDPAWDEPARPADDGSTGRDTSALPDAQERAMGWENSSDEPPPNPMDDPEVSITQRLNAGVLQSDQAIVAADAQAEAQWEAEIAGAGQIASREQTAYERALEQHDRTVAAQTAEYNARMDAWRAQTEACRRGVRDACVTWHRQD